jgi:hypothetical protein
LGKPQSEENFDFYKFDDISVYIKKAMQIKNNGIHIFLRKLLWIKELEVDGISIDY